MHGHSMLMFSLVFSFQSYCCNLAKMLRLNDSFLSMILFHVSRYYNLSCLVVELTPIDIIWVYAIEKLFETHKFFVGRNKVGRWGSFVDQFVLSLIGILFLYP